MGIWEVGIPEVGIQESVESVASVQSGIRGHKATQEPPNPRTPESPNPRIPSCRTFSVPPTLQGEKSRAR